MKLITKELHRLAYAYSDAQQVTKNDWAWHCFGNEEVYALVPNNITLYYTWHDTDIDIVCLSDTFLSFILLADDPYK